MLRTILHNRGGQITDIVSEATTNLSINDEKSRTPISRSTGMQVTVSQFTDLVPGWVSEERLSTVLRIISDVYAQLDVSELLHLYLEDTWAGFSPPKWLFLDAMELLDKPRIAKTLRNDLALIIERFSALGQVDRIFSHHENGDLVITVLTSNEMYDDVLMDRMLDIEFELSDRLTSPLLFVYLPSIDESEQSGLIPRDAVKLYDRKE